MPCSNGSQGQVSVRRNKAAARANKKHVRTSDQVFALVHDDALQLVHVFCWVIDFLLFHKLAHVELKGVLHSIKELVRLQTGTGDTELS